MAEQVSPDVRPVSVEPPMTPIEDEALDQSVIADEAGEVVAEEPEVEGPAASVRAFWESKGYERNFNEPEAPPLEPMCRHLRSKIMFVTGMLEPSTDIENLENAICWCNKTQDNFGVDGQWVGRRECDPKRTCFEKIL